MVHFSLLKENPMKSPPSWSIHSLLPGLPILLKRGPEDIRITRVTHRSEDVTPGSCFVAIKGYTADGHTFIPEALRRGAQCIVLEDPAYIMPDSPCLFIQVPDTRQALAIMASNFYGHPSRHLTLIGITGTNGKTTISYLIEAMLTKAGIANGVLGTINYRFGDTVIEAKTTTPDPLILQGTLSKMVMAGIEVVSMEVSSHALSLHRVDNCQFDMAVWTNLSQDHLDFHHTMEAYFEAKKDLFLHHLTASKKRNKRAILNLDDPYGRRLVTLLSGKVPLLTYGTHPEADIHPRILDLNASGTHATIHTPEGDLTLSSRLIGHHNLLNLLAAVSVGRALGLSDSYLRDGLASVSIPGRLQRVENPLGVEILIDYAHTPDALENVLKSIRPLARRRVITVFGCGGDRDRGKRPLMGTISEKLSDIVILTDDNPRTEDSAAILDEIETGISFMPSLQETEVSSAIKGYIKVPDRKRAIHLAIHSASPGDIVLIAGKGHEPYQILGTRRIPFSDVSVAEEALGKGRGTKQ